MRLKGQKSNKYTSMDHNITPVSKIRLHLYVIENNLLKAYLRSNSFYSHTSEHDRKKVRPNVQGYIKVRY